MSIATLYVVASRGMRVTVPDIRLDVAPVAESVAMNWRRDVAGAPAGDGDAVDAVEVLDGDDAHAAASASASHGSGRI